MKYLVYLDVGNFCGGVEVDENERVINAPPFFKKFEGQTIERLVQWSERVIGIRKLEVKQIK